MIYSIAITGPTASGKTALSIEFAKRVGAEIISADSMQIYKYMNIGTAKPTEEERAEVPHHLIDFLSPRESYSAESYRADALAVAREICSRGALPLFVGGTGLYIDTVKRDHTGNAVPESDRSYREKIESGIKTPEDIRALWERLREVDPVSAEKIHENNVRRVIRALEIYDATGKPKSYFDALSTKKEGNIELLVITLDFHNRETLYERIDRRVDLMVEEGLIAEARWLYDEGYLRPGTTASQAIGYKELLSYLTGNLTLSEALDILKTESRRYAKRQLTWFRSRDCVRIFLDREDGTVKNKDEIIEEMLTASEEYRMKNA